MPVSRLSGLISLRGEEGREGVGGGGGGGDFRKVHSMSIKINEIKVLKS